MSEKQPPIFSTNGLSFFNHNFTFTVIATTRKKRTYENEGISFETNRLFVTIHCFCVFFWIWILVFSTLKNCAHIKFESNKNCPLWNWESFIPKFWHCLLKSIGPTIVDTKTKQHSIAVVIRIFHWIQKALHCANVICWYTFNVRYMTRQHTARNTKWSMNIEHSTIDSIQSRMWYDFELDSVRQYYCTLVRYRQKLRAAIAYRWDILFEQKKTKHKSQMHS